MPSFALRQRGVARQAMTARPVNEGHVRAAGVVGPQDLPDDQERVVDPTGPKGPSKGLFCFADTQRLSADVGMTDFVVAAGIVRFLRHHAEFLIFVDPGPVPDKDEWAEIDVFQNDSVSQGCDGCRLLIDGDVLELSLERQQILIDVPGRRRGIRGGFRRVVDMPLQVIDEPLDAGSQGVLHDSRGGPPTAILGRVHQALQAGQVGHRTQR
jgi:hypothetical protein